MRLPIVLGDLIESERALADSYRVASLGHAGDADVHFLTMTFANECEALLIQLADMASRYNKVPQADPERIHPRPLALARTGPLGLLRDLQDLHALADRVEITCTLVRQAGMTLDDQELVGIVTECRQRAQAQLAWLRTALEKAAPQALIIG